MRKPVLAVLAAVIALGAIAPASQARPHHARQVAKKHRAHRASDPSFTLHIVIPSAAILTNPAPTGPPAAGTLFLIGGTGTFTGDRTGKVYFTLAFVDAHTSLLNAVLAFKNGTITAQGLTTDDTTDSEHYAITGGTGRYRSA